MRAILAAILFVTACTTTTEVTDLGELATDGKADFRAVVLTKGWAPVVNPQCKANLVGEGAESVCAESPQLTSCKICDELPELDSCSSDAHCLMRFRHPGSEKVLEAVGYGEVEYWKETGNDAGLQVSSWEFLTRESDKKQ